MDLSELILSRRTIRQFKADPIPTEVLDRMAEAARLAPSAANRQPIELVVIDEPERVDEVFPLVKWAGYIAPDGDPPEGRRPVAYILILINKEKTLDPAPHDAAAAAMSMIYIAMAEGIGACWMAAIDRPALKRLFNVPTHCEIDTLLALGYPDESPQVVPFEGSIKYWKDESGVLRVPKRPLDDVVHRNGY